MILSDSILIRINLKIYTGGKNIIFFKITNIINNKLKESFEGWLLFELILI